MLSGSIHADVLISQDMAGVSQLIISMKFSPSPNDWGWKFQDGKYVLYWADLLEASSEVQT